ncbi:MAG TPA: CDP-glycerol glycerophosphotransferase family protein [Pyrinomonadaceae bacterium]|nr:CDP-glycerol glycerophosphotransferase family protein [Pyrinomonadaceae bacterium]
MSLKRVITTGREIDKQWQRWRSPDRRRLLLDARTAMNYATVSPIVERLERDPRLAIYFTASEAPSQMEQIFAEARQRFTLITPFQAWLTRFDVYLAADFLWAKLPRGARRVQTFHGVAGKHRTVYDSPLESMRSWDRLFFINERRLRHFIESGAIDEGSQAARLIGMPKLDCLVDGSLKRDELLSAMGIDPDRKTILYAPTWSAHSSVVSMGEELVKRLGESGYAVIVKLHDRSRDFSYVNSGGEDWGARLEPILKKFGGVLATGTNSSPYLSAADIMITDHSSVGFEYLLLDRPLIRIHVPKLIKNTDIEPIYVELLASASTSVTNIDETIAAVERGFFNPRENSNTRMAVANEMFYKPGTATDRAVKELYELMELEPRINTDFQE